MNYETFRDLWLQHLRASSLPVLDTPRETLDLSSMSRRHEVVVEPLVRGDAEPFHIAATLGWEWNALHTARTYTSDDDVRVALLGDRAKVRTEKPWLRVDLALRAALGSSQLLPMPTPATWKAWAVETISRLDSIERLIPEKDVRERKDGLIEILAWKDTPEVTVHCEADGNLYFSGVSMSAWQSITLPRVLDDAEREDEGPEVQLRQLFRRLTASLSAWSEVMDHLRP